MQQEKVVATHVCGFAVVVMVGDVAGEAKVSDLQHVVFPNQHIPGCYVSMNALHCGKHTGNGIHYLTYKCSICMHAHSHLFVWPFKFVLTTVTQEKPSVNLIQTISIYSPYRTPLAQNTQKIYINI